MYTSTAYTTTNNDNDNNYHHAQPTTRCTYCGLWWNYHQANVSMAADCRQSAAVPAAAAASIPLASFYSDAVLYVLQAAHERQAAAAAVAAAGLHPSSKAS